MLIMLTVGVAIWILAYFYVVRLLTRNSQEVIIEYLKKQKKSKRDYDLLDFAKVRYFFERNSTYICYLLGILLFIYWLFGTVQLLIMLIRGSAISNMSIIIQFILFLIILMFLLFVDVKRRIYRIFKQYLEAVDEKYRNGTDGDH